MTRGATEYKDSHMRMRPMRMIHSAAVLLAVLLSAPTSAFAVCGQPVSEGSGPTVADCIYIARAGFGAVPCSDCVCDLDGSGEIRISDALRCLRVVIGAEVPLECPPCESSTTTTLPSCSPCRDALFGLAEPEELCEEDAVLYDDLNGCLCSCHCFAFCGACIDEVTGTTPLGCLRECKPQIAACLEF